MKKYWIGTTFIFLIASVFITQKYWFANSDVFDPFEFESDLVVNQGEFIKLRQINYPIRNGKDAITIVIVGTDVIKRIYQYKRSSLSKYSWEALAKKTSDTFWTVVFREKNEKGNLACWVTVNHSTSEPTPLQCKTRD